jgi:hypothetical protein
MTMNTKAAAVARSSAVEDRKATRSGRRLQRHRLIAGAPGEHDGGNTANAVQKTDLQPRHGRKLALGGHRRADAGHRHGERHE